MIPGVILSVKEFPLMSNRSKIDRKGLLSKYLNERNVKEDNVIEDSTPFMYIKSLLEKKLGFVINMNDTLITAGGSSIDAVYLVNELNDKYNFVTERIPVSVVYESKVTLQRLSEYVQVRLDTGTFGCSEYDYELEAKLDDDIRNGIIKLSYMDKERSALSNECVQSKLPLYISHAGCRDEERNNSSHGSAFYNLPTILVTGSTGFLGRQLVIELAKQNVNIILLIRGREPRERFVRLASQFKSFDAACMDKIKIVNGDLLQDNFGLSHREYYTLAEQVDIVVHSAADISYIKVYEALREANVIGTQRIIKFCSDTKLKYLHYVSSMGIFGPIGATRGWSDLSETRDYKENLKFLHLENGYIQSKWVAEGIVRDAKACGLNVKIYRPGFVESPLDGSLSNTSDFLCRYLKGCLDLGCYPNLPRKYWLITPVDFIAKVMTMSIMLSIEGIANNVYEDTSVDGDITQLDLFHLTPESRDEFSNNELFEALIGYGYKLVCVPYHQWLLKVQGIMRDRDIEHPLYGVGSYITEKIYGGRHTILAMHHYTPPLVTTNLKEFIKCMNGRFDIDIEPIVWNEETFRGYIQHYIDQGWFPSV
ncbi:Linear gramicidin synthase subunit D [compost metagenome]